MGKKLILFFLVLLFIVQPLGLSAFEVKDCCKKYCKFSSSKDMDKMDCAGGTCPLKHASSNHSPDHQKKHGGLNPFQCCDSGCTHHSSKDTAFNKKNQQKDSNHNLTSPSLVLSVNPFPNHYFSIFPIVFNTGPPNGKIKTRPKFILHSAYLI